MAVASVGLALAGILGGRLEAQSSPLRPRAEDNTFPPAVGFPSGRRLLSWQPIRRLQDDTCRFWPGAPIFLLQRY